MNESRKDKSLFCLTKKFIEMLKKKHTIDLNEVTEELNCTKKRRIYDVSNVLEGVGLIKKSKKNCYTYYGKIDKTETKFEIQKLEELKQEREQLELEEKNLDKEIAKMKMNFKLNHSMNKSFCYVTKKDFIDAFDKDNSTLVLKDFRNIRLLFETDDETATTLSVQTNPNVLVNGQFLKPIQIKLVNSDKQESYSMTPIDENQHEMINEIVSDKLENILTNDKPLYNKQKILKSSNQLRLFNRSLKQKKFLEYDKMELKKLAENVLTFNKYRGKSKFFLVNDKKLVLTKDYESPDFIDIDSLNDEYEENYSSESPSVHDLFDYDIKPTILNEDGEMEEEYIVEALDDEMLQ